MIALNDAETLSPAGCGVQVEPPDRPAVVTERIRHSVSVNAGCYSLTLKFH